MHQKDVELLPMEKAEKYGFDVLTTSELLAIVLRTGQPGIPVTMMTAELMKSNDGKLKMLERRSREELMKVTGIGRVKAFQIEAVLEIMRRYNIEKLGEKFIVRKAGDIFQYMHPRAAKLQVENIWILMLNRANAIIECRTVSQGGTSATVFDLKSILRQVLLVPGIESIIMVHNHPSGTLRPSIQDDNITRQLIQGCEYLGIRMLDHVIVTQDSFYSYGDEGRLESLK